MFYFTGMVRKKKACQATIDPFKFRAKFQSHWRFLFIIFIVYYMLNDKRLVQWQHVMHVTSKTWVQVPGLAISIIFFNAGSYATLALGTTMFHPDQAIHASNMYRSRATEPRNTLHLVKRIIHDPESQQILNINGPKFQA